MLLQFCDTVELRAWLLSILCDLVISTEGAQLHTHLINLLLPRATFFLANNHAASAFLRYLAFLPGECLEDTSQEVNLAKGRSCTSTIESYRVCSDWLAVLKLLAVQLEVDTPDDGLVECLGYLTIVASKNESLGKHAHRIFFPV